MIELYFKGLRPPAAGPQRLAGEQASSLVGLASGRLLGASSGLLVASLGREVGSWEFPGRLLGVWGLGPPGRRGGVLDEGPPKHALLLGEAPRPRFLGFETGLSRIQGAGPCHGRPLVQEDPFLGQPNMGKNTTTSNHIVGHNRLMR